MPLHKQIAQENTNRLGIPTGIEGSSFALTKLTSRRSEPGYLVSEIAFSEWRFLGLARVDGETLLYGPDVKGASLGQILTRGDALPYILRLARAIALLVERGVKPFRFQSEGVIFADSGDVLFLPPELMATMKDSRPLDYRIEAFEAINHPYVDGADGLSFTLGTLAYKVLTGEYPFYGETELDLRDRIRRLRVTPPDLVRPEISAEASALVMQSLSKVGSITLDRWLEVLAEWDRQPPIGTITAQERATALTKADEHRQKAQRSLQSGVFFEKHGRMVFVLALVVVGVGLFAGSILKNILAPRVTSGFTPAQVVEAFYTSIGKLEHATMEDCVVGDTGKGEINEAVNLFVISRQTLAYEGHSYVLDAMEWDAQNRPKVDPPFFLHGVANLEIKREQGEPNPVFLVTYERYARAFEDQEIDTTRPINGRLIVDRCYLQLDKEDWVIYRMDRLKTQPLESP